MATKTVVCPECGAAAAPGRYACVDCGALLAAVGAVPRAWATGVELAVEPAPTAVATTNGAKAPARRSAPRTRRPVASASPPETLPPAPAVAADVAPPVPAAPAERATVAPSVVPEPPPVLGAIPEEEPSSAAGTLDAEEIEARRASLAPLSPSWPPPGDRGMAPLRIERTPAGAYLAPSAVLPPLDVPAAPRSGSGASAKGGANGANAPTPARASESGAARPSLTERLDAFGITADTPRRVAGAGAAIAALGFILPWRSSPFGGDLIDGYLTHWGLAGPGNWVVVGLLLGISALGLTSGRFARVPIRLASVALATLLVGLLWPSLFGAVGKPVGIWIVLAGAILLAVGGVLDARRHEPAESPI